MSSAPGSPPPDAMQAEFDTVAAWTEQAVASLGQEYAVAAACRGSGSPAGLAWLCESLDLQPGVRLLDAGAGVGGPAAYAAERFGVEPVLVDPMPGACVAAARLFGFPTAAAWCQQLPFATSSFDTAWCLGVLCTTTEKAELLRELRRVLAPNGRLGLLVLVQTGDALPEQPEGNSFPTTEELDRLLDEAGFLVVESVDATQLPPVPVTWQARLDRVEEVMAQEHGDEPGWHEAARQGELIGRLLAEDSVRTVLVHAVAT